jgi:centrosomal protein CEP104
MQKSASQALQFLGMYQGVDTAVVSKALLKPILKRDAGKPLPVKGRGELLLQFLPELGLSDQTGLSAPAVMAWVLQYMDHRDGGIRELMVKISTEIYLLVGEQRMQAFLKKCRPAIQDNLTASFERADSRQPADRKTKQKPPANTSNNNNNAQQQNPNDSLSSTFGKEKFNVIHKHAHEHTGQFSHDQGEMSYEDGDQGYCQFCGEEDPSFTDEKLDLHYWQDCPMLTSCKQCEQVIEIPTLDEHLLEECEVANKYVKCKACKAPVVKESLEDHQASAACAPLGKGNNRCPLCSRAIGKGEEGWKVHLLDDGCPQNPRGRR